MADNLDVIPPQRRDAARAALALVTGGHDDGPIALLKGGVFGALIYRVDRGQRSFALRLEPERIALEHQRRGFACMEAAAAIGVAPRVYFADPHGRHRGNGDSRRLRRRAVWHPARSATPLARCRWRRSLTAVPAEISNSH